MADRAASGDQAMGLGGRVQLRQCRPAADPGSPRVRVHRHLPHGAEVDGQAAVADRGAAEAVRAAAHRDLQPGVLREPDRRRHVAGPGAARDHRRVRVDGTIPDRTGLVIVAVRGRDHPAGEPGPQPVQFLSRCCRHYLIPSRLPARLPPDLRHGADARDSFQRQADQQPQAKPS